MKKIALMKNNICQLGGTERVTVVLANALVRTYDCSIITLSQSTRIPYKLNKDIDIFNLYKENKRLRYIIFDSCIKITNYINQNDIKMMIVIGRNNGIIPLIVKVFTNSKLIFCEHGTTKPELYMQLSIKERLYNFLFQKLITMCSDKIVVLTEREKKIYSSEYNVPDERMECIYNFIDDELVNDNVEYSKKSKTIISVGRINESKGYEYLVFVAAQVLKVHPDWNWHIYGDGNQEYRNKIQNLINQYGLKEKVILKGNVNNIYELYNKYSIMVMTSRHEGLPMVLLEAKAKRLPLVSFDIESGPSEIIRDNVDGFLVDPFDIDEMSRKICILIENPELRQKFSDNAYGNIDKFKKETIMAKWINLIENEGLLNEK